MMVAQRQRLLLVLATVALACIVVGAVFLSASGDGVTESSQPTLLDASAAISIRAAAAAGDTRLLVGGASARTDRRRARPVNQLHGDVIRRGPAAGAQGASGSVAPRRSPSSLSEPARTQSARHRGSSRGRGATTEDRSRRKNVVPSVSVSATTAPSTEVAADVVVAATRAESVATMPTSEQLPAGTHSLEDVDIVTPDKIAPLAEEERGTEGSKQSHDEIPPSGDGSANGRLTSGDIRGNARRALSSCLVEASRAVAASEPEATEEGGDGDGSGAGLDGVESLVSDLLALFSSSPSPSRGGDMGADGVVLETAEWICEYVLAHGRAVVAYQKLADLDRRNIDTGASSSSSSATTELSGFLVYACVGDSPGAWRKS